MFDRAVAAHRAGRLNDAEQLYGQAIALSPNNAEAIRLLGVLKLQAGNAGQALGLIERALRLQPKSADTLLNHGMVLKALGRLDDAIASMRRALRLRPGAFDILYNLGNAQREAGRLEDAAASLQRAIVAKPDFSDAHNNLGNTLRQLGRHGDAAESFRAAIALLPTAAPLHFNLGAVVALDGKHDVASKSFRDAINLSPQIAQYHHGLGASLAQLGQHEPAIAAFTEALRLDPDNSATRLELAHALTAVNRLNDAETQLREAVRAEPNNSELHSNLGNLLRDLDEDAAAVASLHTALRLRPDYAPARYVLGVCHLLAGRLEQGWPDYAARFAANNAEPRFATPAWLGENLVGKTLLLHAEQGLGDTIQFCRYAPLAANGAKVILEVQPPLVALLSSLSGIADILPHGATLPPFDVHCPLLDLPLAFHTSLETIPNTVPYLHADPALAAAWRNRCAGLKSLKVGLCWAGNRDFAHDSLRSVPPHLLAMLAVPGVTFVSLQKETGATTPTPDLPMIDWTADLHDLSDTAALIDALDLVISVDTAIVHLAGALGKPTWLLNRKQPDWRWLRDRADSPWYPTLRQFRQRERGDWRDVLDAVARALGAHAGSSSSPAA